MLHQGLRRWLWHLLLASVLIAECGCGDDLDLGTIPPFTHVYVANLGSHTVSVIDLKSFQERQDYCSRKVARPSGRKPD